MRTILLLMSLLVNSVHAYELHDAHLHYNFDVWRRLPAQQALDFLTENNIQRAIFSSTPERGTDKLYELAPDRIIPFIRPYRTPFDMMTWHHKPEIVDYLKQQASKGYYQGLGEFHIWFEDLDGKSIVPEVMQIAAEQNWALSAHTDKETIAALTLMQPSINVIWAHCGFDLEAYEIQAILEKHPKVFCEMSFYEKLLDEQDNLTPEWKTLMEKHPTRFMIGIDTYKQQRWGELPEHAELIQEWLEQLEPTAAELIANGNMKRLFPPARP